MKYVRDLIRKIGVKMHGEVENSDFEYAHGTADELLIELIGGLTEHIGSAAITSDVAKILADYEEIGKWYV